MVYTCFLCKWRSDKHPRRSYHKFPSNDELKQKWLDILGKSNVSIGTRTSLCSLHFEEDCFSYGLVYGRKILKDGSLPTLHLTKGDTQHHTIHSVDEIKVPESLMESSFYAPHPTTICLVEMKDPTSEVNIEDNQIKDSTPELDATTICLVEMKDPTFEVNIEDNQIKDSTPELDATTICLVEMKDPTSEVNIEGNQIKDSTPELDVKNNLVEVPMDIDASKKLLTKSDPIDVQAGKNENLCLKKKVLTVKHLHNSKREMKSQLTELKKKTCKYEAENKLMHDSTHVTEASTSKNHSMKPKKRRTFKCPSCDEVFNNSSELRKHSMQHQVETRHKCESCGKCFNKAFSLKMHKRVHLDKKEKCPLCDVTFALRINLGRHMMTHECTVKCDKCPAKFHTRDQLEVHMNMHNMDKQVLPRENSDRISESEVDEAFIQSNGDVDIKNELDSDFNEDPNGTFDPGTPNLFISNYYDGSLKREDLSHPTQCAIVSKMHKGRSVPDICRLYNLTPEVVNEIWEDREKYPLLKKAGKKTTKYMNSILDTRIVEWFNNQKANDVQVSGKMLQDVAETFAKEFGFVAFNGSKKWLDRFKKRYNISLRGTQFKRDYHNVNHNVALESKWKKQFFKEQWCDVRLGFADEDIYTADEVGLYYNPSKGRIKKLAGKKFIQGYVKDRLSIFMCTNVTGTDKKKLLVCGTEDPLIHSHRNPDTLPVTYIRHSQAHFTTQMFEEYVKYWNRELQILNQKAILILDRATIHSKLQLPNLKLVFVPWKASTGLMPIKNGIYNRFRDEFRRLILEEKAMNALRGVDRNLTCLEALNMIEKAWERTPAELINKCFESTGYDIQIHENKSVERPKVSDDDEEILCKMLKDYDVESYYTDLAQLDQYLTVDEELLTGQGTNSSVFGGNHKVVDTLTYIETEKEEILPISTEKPDSDEKEVIVRRNRALDDLEIVRKYLQTNNTSYETYCSFMEVEKFLFKNPNGNES